VTGPSFLLNERRNADVWFVALMAPPPGQGQGNPWLQVVPLVVIFAIFYFLLIRPARTRQKLVQKMLDALKTGDKVITSGGLLGTVVGIDKGIVQLRIADKVRVDVTRSSIVGLQDQETSSRTEA
jgi:preprotein translocase subunit YajC